MHHTIYNNLTDEELLKTAGQVIPDDPLVTELCSRLARGQGWLSYTKNTTVCPACKTQIMAYYSEEASLIKLTHMKVFNHATS